MNYQGDLIKRERLKHNWSQAGLCKGICTVSYLSKIEKGQAKPSPEILQLLLARLEISLDEELEREAKHYAEELYDSLFSGHEQAVIDRISDAVIRKYAMTGSGLDLLLLRAVTDSDYMSPELKPQAISDSRQLALWKIRSGQAEEAVLLLANAYTYFRAGVQCYQAAAFNSAIKYLGTAYRLAAEEGYAGLMLDAKVFSGNCYSNMADVPNMESEYRIATLLAKELNKAVILEELDYNMAATYIEVGRFEEAYAIFSQMKKQSKLTLHKLAICCEKMGRREEGFDALNRAQTVPCEYPPEEIVDQMLGLVRYRLERETYLHEAEYGDRLTTCFQTLKKELPPGYATFHIPWMIEWLQANRKYKKALELIKDFPKSH